MSTCGRTINRTRHSPRRIICQTINSCWSTSINGRTLLNFSECRKLEHCHVSYRYKLWARRGGYLSRLTSLCSSEGFKQTINSCWSTSINGRTSLNFSECRKLQRCHFSHWYELRARRGGHLSRLTSLCSSNGSKQTINSYWSTSINGRTWIYFSEC